jgi:hypothetical protein
MTRSFFLLGGIVLLFSLATTAAFAAAGKSKLHEPHGRSSAAKAHAATRGKGEIAHSTAGASGEAHRVAGAKGASGSAGAPSCDGTMHLSNGLAAGSGHDPTYTQGETVYGHLRGFKRGRSLGHWSVEDVNDHVIVAPDWRPGPAASNWLLQETAELTDGHEYKVTVYWEKTLPNGRAKTCHKSKNFFIEAAVEEGTVGGTEETPDTDTGALAGATEAGGVAGATASGGSRLEGGAAGALRASVSANLPFTGMPIWIALLAGLALLTMGLILRRGTHVD